MWYDSTGDRIHNSTSAEHVNHYTARIVTGLTSYANLLSIYKETGWEKLSVRREKRKLLLFYNIVSGQSPDYLQDLLPITFFPSTIRLLNNLPTELRNYPNQQMLTSKIGKVDDMADKLPLYFYTGIIIANIVHARLRKKM